MMYRKKLEQLRRHIFVAAEEGHRLRVFPKAHEAVPENVVSMNTGTQN